MLAGLSLFALQDPSFLFKKNPSISSYQSAGERIREKKKAWRNRKRGKGGKAKGKGNGLGFPVTRHLDLMLVVIISFIVDEAQIG
jgi:hypothetical protein